MGAGVCLIDLWFCVPVNSYGHVGMLPPSKYAFQTIKRTLNHQGRLIMFFILNTFIIIPHLKIILSSASEIIIIIHRSSPFTIFLMKLSQSYNMSPFYVLYVHCRGRAVTNFGKACGPINPMLNKSNKYV